MTDHSGTEVGDEHIAALRMLLEWHPDAAERYENLADGVAAVGYTLLIYAAFAVAARRRFSPTFTKAQVARYVADLRISLEEDASQINPRVAEGMIRAALQDQTLEDSEPYGADSEAMVKVGFAALLDLFRKAELEGADVDEFLRESADYARAWLATQQTPAGTIRGTGAA